MANLKELMEVDVYNLIYLHYDTNGNLIDDIDDVLYCEDCEIDISRIEKLEGLLVPISDVKSSLIPMEAAKLLAAWGNENAIDYLERCIDQRIDRLGNLEPHRLYSYDTTYERILCSLLDYHARNADSSEKQGINAKEKIFPIIKKILLLSKEINIDLGYLIRVLDRNQWVEYLPLLQECYLDFSKRAEDDLNRKHNLSVLTALLQQWCPSFIP